MTLSRILQQVEEVRKKSELPLILMGYLNPIAHYGFADFVRDAESAGADGFIIPDLIPEEFAGYNADLDNRQIGVNFLVSPNTTDQRLELIDELTGDFIYCVSLTGVTGSRTRLPAGIVEYLARVKQHCRHPYLVGFGISTPEAAQEIAGHSDGIIIGSALINLIGAAAGKSEMHQKTAAFTRQIKEALKGA
jgi:tryptophan synthase alpha chain